MILTLWVRHGKQYQMTVEGKSSCCLKKKDLIPTEIAEHFNFTLPALSSHLRILKEADLITEHKEGKNRFYSLNRAKALELVEFFEDMYDYSLKSLKEYVENKEAKKK